jgi:uncharacterized protein (TIGR02246 family)
MPEQPIDEQRVATWIAGYVAAWNSNEPAAIAALFSEDASYRTDPYSPPWQGRDAIVEGWLGARDEPGETRFAWRLLHITGDVAVVQGTATYRTPPRTYSNLWLIRLQPDGRCREFTEWWMQHPA